MEIYKPFDIVLVPFPFTDRMTNKKRPALVLSNEDFNQANRHYILTMITSAKHSTWLYDVNIEDVGSAGLTSDSVIRFKIFTLDERVIIKQLGVLNITDIETYKNTCGDLFALKKTQGTLSSKH